MRLKSMETTPYPNCMKLNVDHRVSDTSVTYTAENRVGCPDFVEKLLAIPGVKSVFVFTDFVTLGREARSDWTTILDAVAHVFADPDKGPAPGGLQPAMEPLGQVKVQVQTFRGVPIQVKASDGRTEKRVALHARFADAVGKIQTATGANYLKERYWADHGKRYGTVEEVAAQVAEEIEAVTDEAALAQAVEASAGPKEAAGQESHAARTERAMSELASDDWHQRYRALQELGAHEEVIEQLARALKDSAPQVRRFAAALLGGTGSPRAVPPLCEALTDPSVGVRRTAGDSLSDIGDPAAQEAMCRALSDASRLVRWRAARYLAEVGTELALPHLDNTSADPEFEVRFEAQAAIDRIRGGTAASTPMWKRISKGT